MNQTIVQQLLSFIDYKAIASNTRAGLLKKKKDLEKNLNEDNTCAICLDALEDDIQTFTCGHKYHKECIELWKKKSNECPQCKKQLEEGPFDGSTVYPLVSLSSKPKLRPFRIHLQEGDHITLRCFILEGIDLPSDSEVHIPWFDKDMNRDDSILKQISSDGFEGFFALGRSENRGDVLFSQILQLMPFMLDRDYQIINEETQSIYTNYEKPKSKKDFNNFLPQVISYEDYEGYYNTVQRFATLIHNYDIFQNASAEYSEFNRMRTEVIWKGHRYDCYYDQIEIDYNSEQKKLFEYGVVDLPEDEEDSDDEIEVEIEMDAS